MWYLWCQTMWVIFSLVVSSLGPLLVHTPKMSCSSAIPFVCVSYTNYLRMNYGFEKLALFQCQLSGSISLKIWEEHGIHCMPCSSRIISEMTQQICYHSNYGTNKPTVVLSTLHDLSGIGARQTVYAILHQFFNNIKNWNSLKSNFRFSQTNDYSQII